MNHDGDPFDVVAQLAAIAENERFVCGRTGIAEVIERGADLLQAYALAAAARQSGDAQQAPGEAPQSGGDSRNAHTNTPQSTREPGHLANNQPGTDK